MARYVRGFSTWIALAALLATAAAFGFEAAWNAALALLFMACVIGTIDLRAPFEARCLHDEGEWTVYRVKQASQVIRIAVPFNADGQTIRETLRLSWPPPAPNPFRYLGAVVALGLATASVVAT